MVAISTPVGRLSLAWDDHDRLAAFDVTNMDRQEAAGIVMRIEERQLLAAVPFIHGVVDVECDG